MPETDRPVAVSRAVPGSARIRSSQLHPERVENQSFTSAGGVNANRVAKWDGSSWSALGSGVGDRAGDSVYALAVSGPDLYVGGNFTTADGLSANYIAKWNGTDWTPKSKQENRRLLP